MAGKLFGTDGVRGVVGEAVTAELALALGNAAATVSDERRPQVLIVRDTRESGPMLEAGLAAGVAAAGGDAWLAGVLPTPAASILVRRHGLDLAAVISASHNQWTDNGIKFFDADGRKLDDETEGAIESQVLAGRTTTLAGDDARGGVRGLEGALDDYLRELQTAFPIDLSGRRVVLDCAHGATYRAAPAAFERLGAEVEVIGAEPTGRNINAGFGSTSPEALAARVPAAGASVGFAFDGDGDRVLAVDRRGAIRDGDELIALVARHLASAGRLNGGVAVTVMTNHGFHQAMAEAGVEVETTAVGDRHLSEALAERGWSLGGEQSGHIIWTEFAPTGDGIAAALLAMSALGERDLGELAPMAKLPQLLRNVEVSDREAVAGAKEVWAAVERENAALEGHGRVLIRPSGTEPLVRVMVEAGEEAECEAICERLVAVVERELGTP